MQRVVLAAQVGETLSRSRRYVRARLPGSAVRWSAWLWWPLRRWPGASGRLPSPHSGRWAAFWRWRWRRCSPGRCCGPAPQASHIPALAATRTFPRHQSNLAAASQLPHQLCQWRTETAHPPPAAGSPPGRSLCRLMRTAPLSKTGAVAWGRAGWRAIRAPQAWGLGDRPALTTLDQPTREEAACLRDGPYWERRWARCRASALWARWEMRPMAPSPECKART